jgi:DNA-binding transcriptional MerR regulator
LTLILYKHFIQSQLELRKTSRIELLRRSGMKISETEDVVDEEEFKLMKDVREAKRSYKNGYEQLQKYRSSLSQTMATLEAGKVDLASAFAEWGAGRGHSSNYQGGKNSSTFHVTENKGNVTS